MGFYANSILISALTWIIGFFIRGVPANLKRLMRNKKPKFEKLNVHFKKQRCACKFGNLKAYNDEEDRELDFVLIGGLASYKVQLELQESASMQALLKLQVFPRKPLKSSLVR